MELRKKNLMSGKWKWIRDWILLEQNSFWMQFRIRKLFPVAFVDNMQLRVLIPIHSSMPWLWINSFSSFQWAVYCLTLGMLCMLYMIIFVGNIFCSVRNGLARVQKSGVSAGAQVVAEAEVGAGAYPGLYLVHIYFSLYSFVFFHC